MSKSKKKKKYPTLAFRPGEDLNSRFLGALPRLNLSLSEALRQATELFLERNRS